MNEIKKIKCPLCGAPAVVHITDEPRWMGSDCVPTRVSYEYDEPAPPPDPTMMGYQLNHLQMVAELIRQHGVTPKDLHDLKDNFQRAFDIIHAEQERMTKSLIDQALQNFQVTKPEKNKEENNDT